MYPSLPLLCWVKLLQIGNSVPHLTWCICFLASLSPLTEGQSNFSWWALSVCIVFVPSEQWGSRPDFRSFLSAYFPIVPNLTMLFIFAKVYRLFWAGQHSPRNWKIHIYYIYDTRQFNVVFCFLWWSEIFKAAIKSTLKCIGHKYFGVSLQILATWNWRSVLSILFKSKQSFMDSCWLICCDLRVPYLRLVVTCDWRDICNEHANMFLVLILSKLSMAAGPTSVKFLTKWRVISRPMISEYSRRDVRSRLEIDTRRVSIHPDGPRLTT